MESVTCKNCRQEVEVAMYFYGAEIISQASYDEPGKQYYKAKVSGKATCPVCGMDIHETYWDDISTKDIINLAKGINKHGI